MMPLFNVVESPHMAGMKKAVKQGNTFYLSPAMMTLVRDCQGEELASLLAKISYVELPPFNAFRTLEMAP